MEDSVYEYYCMRCHIKVTTDEPGYVECPKCKSGSEICDYGDFGDYDNVAMGGGSFNWNKK